MRKKDNDYESAEMVVIGAAQEIVRGIKDFPSLDNLETPWVYRTDDWWFYCDCE